ncbi:hypothetical protein IJ22_38040 [Paenibacillus naphthalenovorans]|uniref:Uncharacterized protein n=1 Tax=Paenibacillus naphthalenovorans TaxID=162209 RepID=A0A0U2WCP9_9BACL|nr:hypothetical protein IJ22_38040 [Paenibacillus naphthalenovorans]
MLQQTLNSSRNARPVDSSLFEEGNTDCLFQGIPGGRCIQCSVNRQSTRKKGINARLTKYWCSKAIFIIGSKTREGHHVR